MFTTQPRSKLSIWNNLAKNTTAGYRGCVTGCQGLGASTSVDSSRLAERCRAGIDSWARQGRASHYSYLQYYIMVV